MPLLCHTVTEHGWLIVKSSAPFGESKKEDCDDHGADGDGEVEEVDEERGASRSGKYSCWKDEEKNKTKTIRGKPLEMGAHKKQAENTHVQPSCLLTTAFAKIAWCSRVPAPCASTAPRVLLPLPTSRGCASWDSSRRNRGPFIRQERARRILFAQVFANCRPPPSQGLSPVSP